jgi:hypothetical protein
MLSPCSICFSYVSKAYPIRPLAQPHVCVPEAQCGRIEAAYEWTASTGREKAEVNAQAGL